MTTNLRPGLVALILAGVSLSGCASVTNRLAPVVPDEFRVVTRAPLVLPPDYALRPPTPGEPRPQELQPETAARAALLGPNSVTTASAGEKLLLAKTGADKTDPNIKFTVDDEFGDLAYKEKSFADTVMWWRDGQLAAPTAAGASTATPVNAAAEAARLQALTGGQPVVIVRSPSLARRLKLPGL